MITCDVTQAFNVPISTITIIICQKKPAWEPAYIDRECVAFIERARSTLLVYSRRW